MKRERRRARPAAAPPARSRSEWVLAQPVPGLPPGHCRDLEVVLDDYLDGDLPVARRRQLLAHIRACAPCASRLEELRALLRLLRGLAGPAAPRSLRTAVWERLCREPRRPGRRQLPPPA